MALEFIKVLLVFPADQQMVGIKHINLIGYLDGPRRKSQLLRFSKGQRQIKNLMILMECLAVPTRSELSPSKGGTQARNFKGKQDSK